MDFATALRSVRKHGLSMVADKTNNVRMLAVASKDTGSLVNVKEFCVTAYVTKKLSKQQLKAQGIQPFHNLYAQLAGKPRSKVDIDVVETKSDIKPLNIRVPKAQRGLFGGNPPALNAQKMFNTLRVGIGVTNPTNEYPNVLSVGTVGFYMVDGNGFVYLVSNNHVIGRSNDAAINEAVVQPGTLDLTGIELDMLPTLASLENQLQIAQISGVVQLQFQTPAGTPNNRVDAAIAAVIDSARDELPDLDRLTYGGSILGIAAPYQVDGTGSIQGSARVYKVGRTTGYTEGQVTAIAAVATIPYVGGDAHFVDQIVIQATEDNVGPFSDNGDSGSGILNDRHQLVGLLYAGADTHTLANPIRDVIGELRLAAGLPSLQVITST